MTPIYRNMVRVASLRVLDQLGGRLVPVGALIQQVNFELAPPVTHSEFEDVLNGMEIDHEIVRLNTREGLKVKITDQGQAARLG